MIKKENNWFKNNVVVDSIQFKNYFDNVKFVMNKSFSPLDSAFTATHEIVFSFSNRSDITIAASLEKGEWLIRSSENKGEAWKDPDLSKKILVSSKDF